MTELTLVSLAGGYGSTSSGHSGGSQCLNVRKANTSRDTSTQSIRENISTIKHFS